VKSLYVGEEVVPPIYGIFGKSPPKKAPWGSLEFYPS